MVALEILRNIWNAFIDIYKLSNGFIVDFLGGFLILIAAVFAILAYLKVKQAVDVQKTMQKLADAIVQNLDKDNQKVD